MGLSGVLKISSILFIMLLSVNVIIAQEENNQNNSTETFEQKQEALEGTFQIEMIDTRSLPTFYVSLYDSIRDLRDENEVVYINVSDNMRIKIFPKSIIESNSFQKVERVVYTSSK